jgi:class 3 adenylate cyclase/predicted ATPase
MKFSEVVTQTLAWLQREGRISYRALKREFDLDDEFLADLKDEIIETKRLAVDENGKVLVWVGASPVPSSKFQVSSSTQPPTPSTQSLAERRQLTVMFCDLVGSTALSTRLDPEDLREVVRQYQQTCAEVIQRHEGYIAQYLGDGLLVYFGYPTAHEDDARRAVRAGLEIVQTFHSQVPSPLKGEGQGEGEKFIQSLRAPHPRPLPRGEKELAVRIGIHTGLVVIGDMGASGRTEQLALGETPNVAARIQGLAEPNSILISAATQRLIEEQFDSHPFGVHLVKGIETPITVYHVHSEREGTSSLAGRISLTPLVGREQEVGLLVDRWEQVKEGRGQLVLLSGEPGIGKSRLAYVLREHITAEGALFFEARCSPYHQHSAFYPLIDVLQRALLFARQDTDEEKVAKLDRALRLYDMRESLPLFTALLSLPTPPQYPPLTLTPQKQKERTLRALVQLLVAQAERQAIVSVWEDLHWVDPSSLEFLSLLIEQIPTTKLLLVLTFRSEFTPSWKPRSHISQLVLNRLGRKQVEAMIEKVVEGKELPADAAEQIRVKTDGVPLFVEELTKSVIESVVSIGSIESPNRLPFQLAIPATLQETLLARLDRLSSARQIAQLGATLGREFSYELLHAVAPTSDTDLQAALTKLVEAEILYQRGVGEQAWYFFKHALIQDTAYQSLLKSTRQRYHRQIAQVLEEQFPDVKETEPELLAHHYTEAGLIEQAMPYWQQAGRKAAQRSANAEAIHHLTKGLELLKSLPDTPERFSQELALQAALGPPLIAMRGNAALEVAQTYMRARELCEQLGDTSRLFPVLFGLRSFHLVRGEVSTAHALGEQLLRLAQEARDTDLLLEAHLAVGNTSFIRGEFVSARGHCEHSLALYDPLRHRGHAFLYGLDPGVFCLSRLTWTLWALGYPAQAVEKMRAALTLAQQMTHPYSLAFALLHAAWTHFLRREAHSAQTRGEAAKALCLEQRFPHLLGGGLLCCGWALVEQGVLDEGMSQIQQGLAACRATGARLLMSYYPALLAEACGQAAQCEMGLKVLAEALEVVQQNQEHLYEAELYRLKGQLTLQSQTSLRQVSDKAQTSQDKTEDPGTQPLAANTQAEVELEAEGCFLKAIDIARKQQAKSWELRAVMSLARLRQHQAQDHATPNTRHGSHPTQHEARLRLDEVHRMLSDIYYWFTEGFDTKDLQEAKALIEELSH